jgi:hypothetical protein
MSESKRRYFLAEGPKTLAMLQGILDERKRHFAARDALKEEYGADAVFVRNDCDVVALGFKEKPDIQGLRFDGRVDGYHIAYPHLRYKAGKELKQKLYAASMRMPKGCRHPSDIICLHFDASRWVPVSDGNSRTGMSMAVSVATTIDGWARAVLSIPVKEEGATVGDEFGTLANADELTEIKKSEFVALTEES